MHGQNEFDYFSERFSNPYVLQKEMSSIFHNIVEFEYESIKKNDEKQNVSS